MDMIAGNFLQPEVVNACKNKSEEDTRESE